MSFTLGFRDHEGFHRAALWMAAGGLVAGGIAGIGGAGVVGALYAGTAGAVLGAGVAERNAGRPRMAARAALLALAVGAFALVRGHAGVVALAAVAGLALNLGGGWRRGVAGAVLGGGAVYLGGFAAGQVMIARETAPLPDALQVTIAALAMAIVSVAALLPRHLEVVRDAIAAARRALPASLDPEVRALVDRGFVVWQDSAERLDPDGRALLRDGVLRLHDLAGRWAEADPPAEARDTLANRAADLDARIDAATDDVARAQYREAREAVGDQLRLVDGIAQSRERVLARLHACVTTLEKFRLAAAHLETQSASRQALDPRGATALLAEATADIDACGEALAELARP